MLAGALVVLVLIVLAGAYARKAARLLREVESTQLMADADWLQEIHYDASLLVNLEAVWTYQTLHASAGLLRRFVSHPYLSTFLSGHTSEVYDMAFSPEGRQLASASADRTVILWDAVSGKPLVTLAGAHQGPVYEVAFSPDGKQLASAGGDGR